MSAMRPKFSEMFCKSIRSSRSINTSTFIPFTLKTFYDFMLNLLLREHLTSLHKYLKEFLDFNRNLFGLLSKNKHVRDQICMRRCFKNSWHTNLTWKFWFDIKFSYANFHYISSFMLTVKIKKVIESIIRWTFIFFLLFLRASF